MAKAAKPRAESGGLESERVAMEWDREVNGIKVDCGCGREWEHKQGAGEDADVEDEDHERGQQSFAAWANQAAARTWEFA